MNDKSTSFQQKNTINAGGSLIDFTIPRVMGILNITPDSFYQGSRTPGTDDALRRAEKLLSDGAAMLDIGAYSTRPGAAEVSVEEEIGRIVPVIKALVSEFPTAILSVDTFRASVARASVEAGAHIINDISGGDLDPQMFETVAALRVPYILMHMRGTPQTMTSMTGYEDIFREVLSYFAARIARLKELHVHDIILDPGFGFAKNAAENFELLNQMEKFSVCGLPVLAGLSRKRTIWQTLGISSEEALNGTTVLNTVALQKGASILRVHDVREAVEAVKLIECLKQKF
ncbi:MAG: dihydropteroate synthase [Arcticibacter sp.]